VKAHFDRDADFERVEAFLRAHSGMDLGAGLRERALRAVKHTSDRFGCSSPGELLDLMERDTAVLDELLDELTVGETYFFREPEQFEAVRRIALPDVVGRRGPNHTLRAWSAGCATGEEAYSIAIMCAEEGLADRTFVLGTDLSLEKLARARAGVYRDWSLRGPGAEIARPHLQLVDGRHRVSAPVRQLVSFRRLNLVAEEFPSLETGTWEMDLIFCRNVLIYFDRATIERVASRLYAALAPDGWLFTAGSDPLLTEFAPFTPVMGAFGVAYRRIESGVAEIPVPARPPAPATPSRQQRRPVAIRANLPEARAKAPEPDLAGAVEAYAAGEYDRAIDLASRVEGDAAASALRVRALANRDGSAAALRNAEEAVDRHPLSTELHYLRASLLIDLGRDASAADVLRQVLFLDRTLAIAHFTLAMVLLRLGDARGARRSLRNALDACRDGAPDDALPLGDGERVGSLTDAARACLERLDAAEPKA
jgi:chemotaxis protein methyltransferase CheR